LQQDIAAAELADTARDDGERLGARALEVLVGQAGELVPGQQHLRHRVLEARAGERAQDLAAHALDRPAEARRRGDRVRLGGLGRLVLVRAFVRGGGHRPHAGPDADGAHEVALGAQEQTALLLQVLTDLLQLVVMFFGALLALPFALERVGGVGSLLERAAETKPDVFSWGALPTTLLLSMGLAFTLGSIHTSIGPSIPALNRRRSSSP